MCQMAIFRVITFLIHAIVAAMASMLGAIFTHLLPGLLAAVVLLAAIAVFCTTCGIGGLASWRRRSKERD
jgi:hypothetical protein